MMVKSGVVTKIIDCIDYVTGIGNTYSIYSHSVFRCTRASTVIPSTAKCISLYMLMPVISPVQF